MIDFKKRIKNSDKFRQAAIQKVNTGEYCPYPKGTTEYFEFWRTEQDRCIHGWYADDGDFIPGYYYFYLNYCPIVRIVWDYKEMSNGNKKLVRVRKPAFPDFYDYDYYFFMAVEEAERQGKHLCVTKARRKGYSYKLGAMMCRNFFLIANSKSYAYAANKQYLTEDGILTKAWDYMDYIDEHTAWGKKRQAANTTMRRRASFFVTDEFGNKVEAGYKSEILGVSMKDNPDVVRGKAGKLIVFEESGSNPHLQAAWQIARPSVEQDGVAFGLMIMFGCVCAGSRVWTNDGNCVNVEDIKPEDGIIGWDTYQAVPQNISNINPPSEKECLEITLRSGTKIRCSKDHPLLWSTPGYTQRVPGKRKENEHKKKWLWHPASKCKVGEQVGMIDMIPYFGNKRMWEPRLVGWFIGDGSYGINKSPVLSNCEPEILGYCYENFDVVSEKEYITKSTNQLYQELRIKGITKQLRELQIYGQTKDKKRLPVNFHEYDRETLQELLGGIYDTDGYIRFSKTSCAIVLTQSNREILDEIREALLHFGIHGSIRFIKTKNRHRKIQDVNGEYRLEIRDIVSLSRFAERIPLTVERKNAALDLIALFTTNHVAKHNKYVSGVIADKIVKIEDIGLQPIYNLTAKEQNNYIVNGIITHNTGGDQGDNILGLKDAFYNPIKYNCLQFDNIWDEGVTDRPCGFFVPDYTNLDVRDTDGTRLYMDNDGNTLTERAREYVLGLRAKELEGSSDSRMIDRYVAEHPMTPSESFLEFNGNIFPKKELQNQLARIRTTESLRNSKQIGELIMSDKGKIRWNITGVGDILNYPLGNDQDPTGAIVIWEHPPKDIPNGMYIIGVDPYDHDQSGTNSLGATFVYKRSVDFETNSDVIVAEYTGRPRTAEEYYENVRKLALYYNATIMYENERKGLFPYFTQKHSDYLLADQPTIIKDVVKNSKVQRGKGCHMSREIKIWGEGLIKEWLTEEVNGLPRLHYIYSEPLLEELISYNDKGNFDRVMAMMQVMIYREQLYHHKVQERNEEVKANMLFDTPLFGSNWFAETTHTTHTYTTDTVEDSYFAGRTFLNF